MRATYKFILICLVFVVGACVNAPYTTTRISSHLEVITDDCDETTLVVYDVDETLVQPSDSFLSNEHTVQGRNFLSELVKKYPKKTDWGRFRAILLRDASMPMIEVGVLNVIKKFREKGAKVIALTSMNTGKIGFYQRLEAWRYEQLKSLGFEGDFPREHFPLRGFKRNPVFYRGVLAADLENKGEVLSAFLKKVQLHPRKIIAIDDDIKALNQVGDLCKRQGMSFQGYLYSGAKQVPWKQKVIDAQAEHLINNGVWIDDQKIQGLFKTN